MDFPCYFVPVSYAPATDPTILSVKKFDDLSQWEVRRGVPVFDEHEQYDVKKLRQIADNCNRREAETGDSCPITIGHTVPGASEERQPEIVGYARNFQVGTFGPAGKTGVLADFYIQRGRYDEAMKYPRRSVELWPEELYFDPISLLKRTPKRDLGLLTYGKTKKVLRYAMGEVDQEWAVAVLRGDAPPASEPERFAMSSQEEDLAERFMCHYMGHDPLMKFLRNKYGKEAGCDGPECYEAAYAGPNNTYLPGGKKKMSEHNQADDVKVLKVQMVKLTRDLEAQSAASEKFQKEMESQASAYSKLQGEHEKLLGDFRKESQTRQDWEKRYYAKEREAALKTLADDGYQFDMKEELEYVEDFTAEKFAKHLERIQKQYRQEKKPLANGFYVQAVRPGDPEANKTDSQRFYKELSKADSDKVMEVALAKGISYQKARAELFPGK